MNELIQNMDNWISEQETRIKLSVLTVKDILKKYIILK